MPMTDAEGRDGLSDFCAIVLASAITLIIRGYQFGQSNHTIYLLDALRLNDPSLFKNDWFVTHTYQYHFVFTHLAALLDRLRILRPAFLVGYFILILAWQAAWLRLTKLLGGNRRAFMLSVVLFFLSAGGFGLGFYDFLQDSAMLPSNIANMLMLWGLVLWIGGSVLSPAILLGLAGLVHLNDAVVSVGLWLVLVLCEIVRPIDRNSSRPGMLAATLIVLCLCLANIIPAFLASQSRQHVMPLSEFVDLYVRLRHPHHYDPSSWPAGLWISFFWPFPLAIAWICTAPRKPALLRTFRVLIIFCAVMLISLLAAGVWYINEALIQMSLSRFSIYPKLLTCAMASILLCRYTRRPIICWIVAAMAAGVWLLRNSTISPLLRLNGYCIGFLLAFFLLAAFYEIYVSRSRRRPLILAGLTIEAIALLMTAWRHQGIGFQAIGPSADSPAYLQVCEFARQHTPVDSVFLVPPDEESFRLVARRAIVINFKGVPQFDGELAQWRDRLCGVLHLPTLQNLPHRFDAALRAIGQRYAVLPTSILVQAAESYGARYIVVPHPLHSAVAGRLIFENQQFYLYDLDGS